MPLFWSDRLTPARGTAHTSKESGPSSAAPGRSNQTYCTGKAGGRYTARPNAGLPRWSPGFSR